MVGRTPLITTRTYDASGNLAVAVDPQGIKTYKLYDMQGRVMAEIDGFTGTYPLTSLTALTSASGQNQITTYQYNGDNEVTQQSVQNFLGSTAQASQVTSYGYGTTGSLDKSKLAQITYPGGTYQSNEYDWLGDEVQMRMQDGTLHHYEYDQIGRMTSDFANYFGKNVDTTVQALSTSYDVLNRPVLMTTEGAVDGAWKDLNQVKDVYTPFGEIWKQFQASTGDVLATNSNTLVVQYGYSSPNPTELIKTVYPDGRVEWYTYSGLDAAIGRVTSVNDGTASSTGQSIENYSYLGLGTVVDRGRAQADTNEAISLDAYGRPSAVVWTENDPDGFDGAVTDSFAYTYNADSKATSVQNNGDAQDSESYGYDALDRETSFQRGSLTNGVSDATQAHATWAVDSIGNKYNTGGVSRYPSQYNASNQPVPTNYTQSGNQKTIPLPNGTITATYDAWGRLVSTSAQATGSEDQKTLTYSYDALGRQILQSDYETSTRTLYDGQNAIEVRDEDGHVTTQYVWSAAGAPTVILRDLDSDGNPTTGDSRIPSVSGVGLDQRLYAQADAMGSTTSITDVNGNVIERYLYDQGGQPTAVHADWTPYTFPVTYAEDESQYSPPSPAGYSKYDWTYLYHGGNYQSLLPNKMTAVNVNGGGQQWAISAAGGGLYTFGAGSNWYDPYQGASVQPNYSVYAPGYTPSTSGSNDPYNLPDFSYAGFYATAALGMGQQLVYTVADYYRYSIEIGAMASDYAFGSNLYTSLPFAHNSSLSSVGQMLDHGQTSWFAATGAATPVFGAAYNAYTGHDLLTGDLLNGQERWLNGISALGQGIALGVGIGGANYVRPVLAGVGRIAGAALEGLSRLEPILDALDPANALMPGVIGRGGRVASNISMLPLADGEVPLGSEFNSESHNLVASLYREGDLVLQRQFVSGNLSADELELAQQQGMREPWRIGDTENRAMRAMDLQMGETLLLDGQFSPCESCQSMMISRAMETGAEIQYRFLDNAGNLRIWSAQQGGYIYAGF